MAESADKLQSVLGTIPGNDALARRVASWREAGALRGEATPIHALLLNLKRLDAVNLSYGSRAGDEALIAVAARMSRFATSELTGPFLVSRGSGGTFLLIAQEAASRERWRLFADELANLVAKPIVTRSGKIRLSPRIALLRVLLDESVESMLDRLSQAMETALRQQGRRLVWADGEVVRPGRRAAQLDADLLGAIDRGEIEVLYQPQFALPGDELYGAEALARWNHPTLGQIGAGALFTIAERVDFTLPLSNHIARLAMAGARDWPEHLRLSINVTPGELSFESFGEGFLALVDELGFDCARLTVEVTEQTLLHDLDLARTILGRLAERGIRIALDDFGAGFCNFRYLKLLPLDAIKLDRSMIEGIGEDPRDLAVLRGMMALAHALGLSVVAEGVETAAQWSTLTLEGCVAYQGFLRAAPMSAAAFADMANSLSLGEVIEPSGQSR